MVVIFNLQIQSGPLTTISGDTLHVYLQRIFGSYDPLVMKCMTNLEIIDISYTHVEPRSFVDAVIDIIGLKELKMNGCTQFTEHHMIEIFCCLPNLRVIEATKNRGFQYVNAHIVCCSLRNLEVLKIEPKYPFYERFDWCKLKAFFRNIDFGKTINDLVASTKK